MPAKTKAKVGLDNGSIGSTSGMTCSTNKVGYSTAKSAEAEVRRIDDAHIVAYMCNECGKWHVGHEEVRAKVRDGHANRAAAHLEAMETKAPASTIQIKLPDLDIRLTDLYLMGDTPLICHAWSEKAKKMILDKQTGVASAGREHKNPEQDFKDSLYSFPGGGYGFPAIAFKSSAVSACTSLGKAITKVAARQAFHVMADDPMTGLVKLVGKPEMRDDMVRVGMGTADIRFRGQFFPWSCNLRIRYNARVLSFEQIANIFNTAGFAVGVGEWRSEKDGGYGQFKVGNKP